MFLLATSAYWVKNVSRSSGATIVAIFLRIALSLSPSVARTRREDAEWPGSRTGLTRRLC